MQEPENEAARVAALESYGVLDTDFEESFDRITRLAAHLFDAPIALVSLVDQRRQWFKSALGLGVMETPRVVAFCAHAILGEDVFVVPDATLDDRFRTNPLVTEDPNVRFYAGAPLRTAEGFNLGTVCIIDRESRAPLGKNDVRTLQDFSDLVVELLETRRLKLRAESIADAIDDGCDQIGKLASDVRVAALHSSQMTDDEFVGEIRWRTSALSERVRELRAALSQADGRQADGQ